MSHPVPKSTTTLLCQESFRHIHNGQMLVLAAETQDGAIQTKVVFMKTFVDFCIVYMDKLSDAGDVLATTCPTSPTTLSPAAPPLSPPSRLPRLLFQFGQPGSICCDNTSRLYLHTIMQLYFIRVYNSSSLAASGVGEPRTPLRHQLPQVRELMLTELKWSRGRGGAHT